MTLTPLCRRSPSTTRLANYLSTREEVSCILSVSLVLSICGLFLQLPAIAAENPSQQVFAYVPSCESTPRIESNTLADLSRLYFGESGYQWSILLATNANSANPKFTFIRNPYQLPRESSACIPAFPEALRIRNLYDLYLKSVEKARLPTPADVSNNLVSVTAHSVIAATWIRESQIATFQKSPREWLTVAPYDIWVTVVPKLKEFCQAFVKEHVPTPQQLTERLEERLGVPPLNGKAIFLEFTVEDASDSRQFYRPCSTSTVATTTCPIGGPKGGTEAHSSWFYSQYYSSYGTAQPYPYPWTTLGYTFDWSRAGDGESSHFTQFGESEFIVPKGARIKVEGTYTTQQYCSRP